MLPILARICRVGKYEAYPCLLFTYTTATVLPIFRRCRVSRVPAAAFPALCRDRPATNLATEKLVGYGCQAALLLINNPYCMAVILTCSFSASPGLRTTNLSYIFCAFALSFCITCTSPR